MPLLPCIDSVTCPPPVLGPQHHLRKTGSSFPGPLAPHPHPSPRCLFPKHQTLGLSSSPNPNSLLTPLGSPKLYLDAPLQAWVPSPQPGCEESLCWIPLALSPLHMAYRAPPCPSWSWVFFFFLVLRVLSQGRAWPEASFVCLALCHEPQSGLTSLPLLGFC